MKIKGVIKDSKIKQIKKMIIVKYIQEFLWSCWGQCGVSAVSDSSLFQLIFLLKVYRPLPMYSMVTTGFQSIAPVTSRAVPSSWFILASSVCKSLQCLTSALTQEGEGHHLFRLTRLGVQWGGRNTASKSHWRVWGVLAVSQPHWVCPRSRRVCFPRLHCSGSSLLCRGAV